MESTKEEQYRLDPAICSGFSEEEIKALESLYKGILTLDTVDEMHKFFADLCSYNEICSFIHRWQILLLINEGKSYEEIIRALSPKNVPAEVTALGRSGERSTRKGKGRSGTTVSSTTISRVKNCYVNADGGYRTALSRLENRKDNK